MEDSKRLWNSETIKIKEMIYKGYRSRFKKNKFDQVEKSVEILAKTMSTTKCTL